MGACAEEIEVSAISIRIAVSSNDLRIMKGCLQPLNIILECRKAATMTFLSSDRRMVPRDYAPTHRCHRDRLCFSWRRSVPILHRNDCAGCAEGALDLESVTIPVFNQTHEALCALGDGAHLDGRRVGALAVAELGPLHPTRLLGIGVASALAYICA